MTQTRPLFIATIAAAFSCAPLAHSAVLYEVVQIGNLPGFESGLPMAINNQNTVVGNSFTNSINKSWIYSESTGMQGYDLINSNLFMRDINAEGESAGFYDGYKCAVRGIPGMVLGWGVLNGYARSEAWGINDLGAMVGWVADANNLQRASRFNNDFTTTILPSLDPTKDSQARRINSAGFAVGHSDDKAVVWTSNNTIVDLHSMITGAARSFASDINEAGWATGYYQDGSGHAKGFRFNFEIGMSYFDPIEGDAFAVSRALNIYGHTVGISRRKEHVGQIEAFVNFGGSESLSLNSLIDPNSGWFLSEATDINDNGYIIGRGTFHGIEANYMLKPVPEPATMAAFGVGIFALSRKRRKKSRS